MSRAWFFRHGESDSNSGLPVLYPDGTGLTARGAAQAERIAGRFDAPPDLIVTSSFRRTLLTAEPLRRRFPGVPHAVWPVEEYTYLGSFVGRVSTLAERAPLARDYWARCDPSEREGDQGESFADLLARVEGVVARLRALPDNTFVAVFSHGLFMGALCWALLTGSFAVSPARMAQYRNIRRSIDIPNGARLRVQLAADGDAWLSAIESLPNSGDAAIAGEEDTAGTLEGQELQPRRGGGQEGVARDEAGAG